MAGSQRSESGRIQYYNAGTIKKKDTNAAIHYCELYLTNAPPNPEEIKFVTNRLAELKPTQR